LSYRGDDREHRLAKWRSGVDLLTKGDEFDPEVTEQLQGLD
jgi:hypothetical protein